MKNDSIWISSAFYLVAITLLAACEPAIDSEDYRPGLKMRITHYHDVKMEGGVAVADSLKDCFSCNQARVYDRNGKELENRWYKANMEELWAKDVYIYGDDGNKTGSNYYAADTLAARYFYTPDTVDASRTLLVRAFHPTREEQLYAYSYGYDEKGNQYQTTNMDNLDQVADRYERQYNSNGVVIEEDILDDDGVSYFNVKYEYRPRADRDWLEQLTYYNDELKEIRIRKFVYFTDF